MLQFKATAIGADKHATGWVPRFQQLLPAASVTLQQKPFGRTLYLVKHEGTAVAFMQAAGDRINNGVVRPSASQRAIVAALVKAGAVASVSEGAQ